MEIPLRLGTRAVPVQLVTDGDGFAATVDGGTHPVVCVATGPRAHAAGGMVVEELALEVDGQARRAVVARRADRVVVAIGGRVFAFETGEEARGGREAGGSGLVTAPMPGKVVNVLVAAGDRVEAGQPLVVLEAMKMESTLAAEVRGCVGTVRAVAGATVAAGDVLVEIVPDAA